MDFTCAKFEYIRKNFKNDIYLKSIADKFNMNSVYLGQLFKKEYGIYFNDYFNQLRIEEAKKLLVKTDMKIYEIAKSIGYCNKEYFVNKFVMITSISPTQFRKLSREKVFDGTIDMLKTDS